MVSGAFSQEKIDRDGSLSKLMHGKSPEQRNAFLSMLRKDRDSHRLITDDYLKHWETKGAMGNKTQESRDNRKEKYMSLVNNYYDLATDLYEEAWSQSFHFCRFSIGEPFLQALARHEHYMAHMLRLQKGMKVLDVGCGVGGPAREIASFSGCNVVGLNNNSYQIDRARGYANRAGLNDQVSFIKGDFMHIDQPENSFDAVYAIEATVHAPSLQGVYEQIYRVLKPGGSFGVFEWVMTDKYDDTNSEHREIRLGIERGNGIANMMSREHATESIKAAGFTLEHAEDLARRPDDIPWYYPLAGELQHVRNPWDLFTVLRMTELGRKSMESLLTILETVRIAPSGTAETANELSLGARHLVAGGKQRLFTPMYLMIAKKPEQ